MVDIDITIPNPDGTRSTITLEDLEEHKKTLGVWDNPLGGNDKHCSIVHDKMEVWINRMKNGRPPAHIAWLGYRLQLWAGLRYGIGTMTNSLEKAKEVFGKPGLRTSSNPGNSTHNQTWMAAPPYYLWRFRFAKLSYRTIHRQTESISTTLPYLLQAESKTRCLTALPPTPTRYSDLSILFGLRQVELSLPTMLDQSPMADT